MQLSTVLHAYSPSYWEDWGKRTIWAQDFETSMGYILRPLIQWNKTNRTKVVHNSFYIFYQGGNWGTIRSDNLLKFTHLELGFKARKC
jgi:hypothetical protein